MDAVNKQSIAAKIREFYPEIAERGLELELSFEESTDSWLARIGGGKDLALTHIARADAEDCLGGRQCLNLAAQVGSFLNAQCGGEVACVL